MSWPMCVPRTTIRKTHIDTLLQSITWKLSKISPHGSELWVLLLDMGEQRENVP